MALPYRPLGLVKQLLEEIGIEVTYAYEDLVFVQHNPILLQFGKVGESCKGCHDKFRKDEHNH